MIDKMFRDFINVISSIITFIIVAGILGFIIIVPLAINGGLIFGIPLYIMLMVYIGNLISEKEGEEKDED